MPTLLLVVVLVFLPNLDPLLLIVILKENERKK